MRTPLNRRHTEEELVELLREALAAMNEEANNNEDEGCLDISCGRCWGASPMSCSLGCRIGGAIFQFEKAKKAAGNG